MIADVRRLSPNQGRKLANILDVLDMDAFGTPCFPPGLRKDARQPRMKAKPFGCSDPALTAYDEQHAITYNAPA